MILKQGQIINDGDSDLIVCDVKEYEGKTYAYMMNDNNSKWGLIDRNGNVVNRFGPMEKPKKFIDEVRALVDKEA